MFHAEGVSKAVMAGQVKHKQIFSSIRPDWLLAKLLLSLSSRNTDGLLGAIAKVLQDEGIELISSTTFLEPLLARPGVLTKRRPNATEQRDIVYGRGVANALAAYDIGQTVVIAAQACVAVEAMEGTDAVILRAGENHAVARRNWGGIHIGAVADSGEGCEAQTGHALRCARDWHWNHHRDAAGRRDLPGD